MPAPSDGRVSGQRNRERIMSQAVQRDAVSFTERLAIVRTGFTSSFWVANVLELFERLAYYGSKAILAIYLAEQVGLGPETGNWLAGSVFNTLLYFLPVLAGPIVDRFGFKRSLMACFAIFSIGYLCIGLAGLPAGRPLVDTIGARNWTLLALIFTAIGGSLIKPSIVGTCARTTTPDTKSLGYSIYYTLVNIGGAIGPMLAIPVRENLGIAWVLVMSSATTAGLFVATTLFFREPERPAGLPPTASMGQVLGDMIKVFSNLRFMLFLVIFSGFWAMFWHIFYALPFYVRDSLKFERFELIETVDAWTIILVTIPAAALAKRLRPIAAMTLGFALASVSWFLMGAVPTVSMTVVAIIVFAVGEAIQSPRYYEYVADLAPKEQVGTYMGFAFIPVALGTFVAGFSSGRLVEAYVNQSDTPWHMWYFVGGIGVVSTLLMVLYDRLLTPRNGGRT
jgi:proton-dependent oligopeptide transporter, POT family